MITCRPAIETIRQACRRIPKTAGVEVGVLGGTNAFSILDSWPELTTLHLVDSYGGITADDPRFQANTLPKFASYGDRVVWHVMTSIEAAKEFAAASLDFAYIDACHAYECVVADLDAWFPKVRPGGLLCGHDYFSHRSVKRAVDEWTKARDLWLFTTDPDWWFYKEIERAQNGRS
jgi:predicted O-methyltransferase YrrM